MALAASDPQRDRVRAEDDSEKDLPLRDDIRLLGRILGDTVREQEGEEVYELVEQIRKASIRFHRDNEVGARRELEATLDSLSADQTLVDRARLQLFLASRQHRRRPASHPPQPRSCDRRLGAASRLARLRLSTHARDGGRAEGARRFLRSRAGKPGADRPSDRSAAQEHVDPRTRDRRIARRARPRRRSERSSRPTRKSCGARCSSCGAPIFCARRSSRSSTRSPTRSRSTITRSFSELPRLYGAIEDRLDAIEGAPRAKPIGSFLRIGSWIGGDRDGNPFVTADVLNEAMRLQSARAISYYLDELHELGGELSLAANLASMSPELDGARRHVGRFRRRPAQGALSARHHRHVFAPRQDGERARPCHRAAPADRRSGAYASVGGIQRRPRRHRAIAEAAPTPGSWRAGGCARCSARSMYSAFISRRSTSGRTPTSTKRRSPRSSPRRRRASTISASTRRSASRCCAESWRRRARSSRRSSPMARRRRANWQLFRAAADDPREHTAPARSAPRSSRRPTASRTCWSWR